MSRKSAAVNVPFPQQPEPPRTGEWVEFIAGTKKPRVRGVYQNGLRHGSWKLYYDNGQIAEDYHWDRGVQHGPEFDYHENGVKSCDGHNRNGVRVGVWTWQHPDGSLSQTISYDEAGLGQGPTVSNNEDGSCECKGTLVDGKNHGPWVYGPTADYWKLERSFRHDNAHGPETAWHNAKTVAWTLSSHDGKRHGREEQFDKKGRPTFRGEWRYGYPIGEHLTWNDARKETRVVFVNGLEQTLASDDKLRAKVAKAFKKARDQDGKEKAITAEVDRKRRAAYLVHLWRSGDISVGNDQVLWQMLGTGVGLLDGADIVRLLEGVTDIDDAHCDILPGWPGQLDALTMAIYSRDPGPIDAVWNKMPTAIRRGLALVRARFGHNDGLLAGEMDALVEQHQEAHGLTAVLWPVDGVVESLKLFSDYNGTRTPAFDRLRALFGTEAEWIAALKKRAMKEATKKLGAVVRFNVFRDFIAVASVPETVKLISAVALDRDTQDKLRLALTEWRHDDVATSARIALAVEGDGLHKWPVVTAAINQALLAEEKPQQALLDAVELASESPTYGSDWWRKALPKGKDDPTPWLRLAWVGASPGAASACTAEQQKMMRALPPSVSRAIVARTIAAKSGYRHAAQYLYLVDDQALWRAFIDKLVADPYGIAGDTMYGLGEVGLPILPLLLAQLEKSDSAVHQAAWHKAVLVALARAATDGVQIPTQYDRLIRFDLDEWDTYVLFVERILAGLPPARAEAALVAGLGTKGFARAFSLLSLCPTQNAIGTAYSQLLAREVGLDSKERQAVISGIATLAHGHDWIRWFRQSGGGAGIGRDLESELGDEAWEAMTEELAATAVAAPTQLDDIDKLRLKVEEASGDERIYLLRRLDSKGADHNVIGGLPPGVEAARWPERDKRHMAHLFTLDVATMPELKKIVGSSVAAISVFCLDPDNNGANEIGSGNTAVVYSTKAQLGKRTTAPKGVALRERYRFEAVAMDVDSDVWTTEGDIRRRLYASPARVLGEPQWLQDANDQSGFLMQFDAGFCDLNLGDSGIMYVFQFDAFWQCH